jgi:hypothetical protein
VSGVDPEVGLADSQVPAGDVVTVNGVTAVPETAFTMVAVCAAGTVCPWVYAKVIESGLTVILPPIMDVPTVIDTLTV